MLQKCLLVVLAVASMSGSFGCPDNGGQLGASGTYVLTEPSTTSDGMFRSSDVGNLAIELKGDGTFYLRFPSVAYKGSWTLSGNSIDLSLEMYGSTMVFSGTLTGDTISLVDGSVWKA